MAKNQKQSLSFSDCIDWRNMSYINREENTYKTNLIKRIKQRFPDAIVVHLDPNEIQGIPDLLILNGDTWVALEGKADADAPHRPNQDYYVNLMNHMSYSAFIYPENEKEILDDIQRSFEARGLPCVPERERISLAELHRRKINKRL